MLQLIFQVLRRNLKGTQGKSDRIWINLGIDPIKNVVNMNWPQTEKDQKSKQLEAPPINIQPWSKRAAAVIFPALQSWLFIWLKKRFLLPWIQCMTLELIVPMLYSSSTFIFSIHLNETPLLMLWGCRCRRLWQKTQVHPAKMLNLAHLLLQYNAKSSGEALSWPMKHI